jgi:hypothetical protein
MRRELSITRWDAGSARGIDSSVRSDRVSVRRNASNATPRGFPRAQGRFQRVLEWLQRAEERFQRTRE